MIRYMRTVRALALAILIGGVIAWPAPAGHAAPVRVTRAMQAAAAPVAATKKAIPGWPGGNAKYVGRYHLIKSSDATLATSGELTVFLRAHVPHQPKPVLSGILSLVTKSQTNVVYLTKFAHSGSKLWTTVNLGIYTGPILGQFDVVSLKGNQLVADLIPQGKEPITLRFVRFSTNPHP